MQTETKTNQMNIVEMTEFLSDMLGIDKAKLLKDKNLITEFKIDITSIIELIMELEDKFDISISDDDIFKDVKKLKDKSDRKTDNDIFGYTRELNFEPTPEGLTNLVNKYLEKKD